MTLSKMELSLMALMYKILSIRTHNKTRLSIITISIITVSKMTLSKMDLSLMTLINKTLSVTAYNKQESA
jgi:hypothetical protein